MNTTLIGTSHFSCLKSAAAFYGVTLEEIKSKIADGSVHIGPFSNVKIGDRLILKDGRYHILVNPKVLTFEIAKGLAFGTTLHHKTRKNTDGTPARARVMGAVKTWKTRPDAIRIPMKRGLRDTFQLGQGETDKPIDQQLKDWELA